VPNHANGKNIHRPVETAYIHCDNLSYAWGAVLNGGLEARGFLGTEDELQHITWKELKAVRLTLLSFLPHFASRNILLHEDSHAVCYVLAGMTSSSPEMVDELRRLNNICNRPRYISSEANTWADKLSRHMDNDDWEIDP
jgi:hypothetical protein